MRLNKTIRQIGSAKMNLHLLVIFGKDAENSPLAVALKNLGVQLTTFSNAIRLNYPQPALRYLVGWPHLMMFSITTAIRSLHSKPPAEVVIVNTHFDLLAFALISRILRRPLPKLVLPGFIYTDSNQSVLANFKMAYYHRVLRYTDVVICHSHLEVEKNKIRFAGAATEFVYFPYATHVSGASDRSSAESDTSFVVSAGRSGRDYELLIEAVRGMNLDLHIVCDQFPEALRAGLPSNVTILDDCYGDCYFDELIKCRFVVLPLSVNDISAGQMVLLQAMALGKPVIITRTATTIDYVQDGDGVLLVEPKDNSAMSHAIQRLHADDSLRHNLGKQASEIFAKRYSIEAYAAHLVDAARMACDSRSHQHDEPTP